MLPNLEDLLMLLNDFDLAEDLCEKLREDPELAEQYKLQIGYFKKNFYKNSTGRADTERFVYSAITELDNLLRYPGVKNILCNRTHNIDFDKSLSEGQIHLICTRRGDLGATAHKAFGLFSILLMQYSVLNRPGIEKDRVPHFLYIDEFPDFICNATEALFTQYRKYRVGTIISIQNIGQL
jgi:type IV secretory pathway TraG/TraD family ATPase VirD4